MFGTSKTMRTGLRLLSGALLLGTVSTAFAALPLPQEQEAPTQNLTSQVAPISLPSGALRPEGAGDVASLNDAMQEVARTNKGKITQSEVLVWSGDQAKTAVAEVNERMKAAGYLFASVMPFDAEPGRVTPIAAGHPDKTERVIGFWIESKDNQTLLVWGRFSPSATPQPTPPAKAAPVKPAPAKPAAAPRKPAAKPRVAAVPRRTPRTRRSSSYSSSAASRQAAAFKAYKDYQYVKYMGPISGPMYRSTKW